MWLYIPRETKEVYGEVRSSWQICCLKNKGTTGSPHRRSAGFGILELAVLTKWQLQLLNGLKERKKPKRFAHCNRIEFVQEWERRLGVRTDSGHSCCRAGKSNNTNPAAGCVCAALLITAMAGRHDGLEMTNVKSMWIFSQHVCVTVIALLLRHTLCHCVAISTWSELLITLLLTPSELHCCVSSVSYTAWSRHNCCSSPGRTGHRAWCFVDAPCREIYEAVGVYLTEEEQMSANQEDNIVIPLFGKCGLNTRKIPTLSSGLPQQHVNPWLHWLLGSFSWEMCGGKFTICSSSSRSFFSH